MSGSIRSYTLLDLKKDPALFHLYFAGGGREEGGRKLIVFEVGDPIWCC